MTKLVNKLKELPQDDDIRKKVSEQLVEKAYNMGLINNKSSLLPLEELTVSSICRRRLAVVMMRLKMSENLKEATNFICHGHIRVRLIRYSSIYDIVIWVPHVFFRLVHT